MQQNKWDIIFEQIYSDYYLPLCVYAQSFVADADEAEEIVQGIILKMWEQKENLESIQSLKSYLYRSVRNTCLNYIKHKKIEARYKQQAWLELKEIEADFVNPYTNVELKEEIERAVESLPERCRQVFEMSRYEGRKNREISEVLGISIKAVEANITRALQNVRQKLDTYMKSYKDK